MKNSTETFKESVWLKFVVVIIVITLFLLIATLIPDYATDFTCFYQAGKEIASGHSPYSVPGYYSPVWVAILFLPLSIFTREIAYRVYVVILFGSYIYIFWKISGQRFLITLIASFTPFIFMTMQYGNIDWLVLLGTLFPAPIGIWLLLTKPQMGFTLALLWAWKIYKGQGIKILFVTFAPVALGLFISYMLGMRLPNPASLSGWSADVWPFGLFIGIPALIISFKKRDDYLALASSPFLTPYLGPMSWAAILPVSMRNYKHLTAAWVLTWIIFIVWRLHI